MATIPATEPARPGPMVPVPHRVREHRQDTADTATLALEPIAEPIAIAPGQFMMLSVFGVGEVPISTSGGPGEAGLHHTIRAVGAVSAALCASRPGDIVGVRGPFGTTWPIETATGGDLLIVAGGIGLAPLRPAVLHALANRAAFGDVALLVGARTPEELLYRDELERWGARSDLDVAVTVDVAVGEWAGCVGLVTRLIPGADVDPRTTIALLCGPEAMMRFTALALLEAGVAPDRIFVSAEHNMQCATGHCGHCQLGPLLICRDGPVFPWPRLAPLMEVREL